jgi:putative ABC transport system permease protein
MVVLWQDTRYGLRMLRRNLRFTIVAVLALGIGIGAITAIYSIIDALVLHPLPQQDSRQLVCFRSIEKQRGFAYPRVFAPIIEDISRQDALLSEVCCFADGYIMRFERDDSIEEVRGSQVSPNFMTFWNTAPSLGRGFLADEGKPSREPVIVLSHRFWQTHCGGREDIIGQTIRLDEQTFTVVGVMPQHFRFPEEDCDFWLPHAGFQDDANLWGVAARLQPGVSRIQVQAMLDTIVPRHIRSLPTPWQEGYGVDAVPLQSLFAGDVYDFLEKTLISVFGAIGFVLLIGCVNTANLLLAQTEARRPEVAVREALGAGQGRLVRQFLTESLLLALLGGLAGIFLSWWLLHVLVPTIPWYVPRVRPVTLNLTMLAFTLLVSVVVGLLVGLAPTLQVYRGRLERAIKEGAAGAGGSVTRRWFHNSLVASEVALCVTLLAGAGLMIRSVKSMLHLDPGFDPAGLLRISTESSGSGPRTYQERIVEIERIHERLASLVGVESVGILMLGLHETAAAEGQTQQRYACLEEGVGMESRDVLRAMRTRLLAGRYLDHSDAHTAGQTVVINEKLAGRFWPGQSAVGKRLTLHLQREPVVLEVIGVVSNTRTSLWGLWGSEVEPTAYRPYQALKDADEQVTFILRTRGDPALLIPIVRRELRAQGLATGVVRFSVIAQDLYNSTAVPRLLMSYMSGFATVGLLLTGIGIYGVLTCSVVRWTREIGIRVAFGAQRRDVIWLIVWQGTVPTLLGVGVGWLLAVSLARFLRHVLFNVGTFDSLTLGSVAVLLGLVAAVACYLPARRATRVDPMTTLRYE